MREQQRGPVDYHRSPFLIPVSLFFDFEGRFDLHRNLAGKSDEADGGAGVVALVSEDLNEEIGAAVYDFWLIAELRVGIHHAEHFDDLGDIIETANRRFDGGENLQSS